MLLLSCMSDKERCNSNSWRQMSKPLNQGQVTRWDFCTRYFELHPPGCKIDGLHTKITEQPLWAYHLSPNYLVDAVATASALTAVGYSFKPPPGRATTSQKLVLAVSRLALYHKIKVCKKATLQVVFLVTISWDGKFCISLFFQSRQVAG